MSQEELRKIERDFFNKYGHPRPGSGTSGLVQTPEGVAFNFTVVIQAPFSKLISKDNLAADTGLPCVLDEQLELMLKLIDAEKKARGIA